MKSTMPHPKSVYQFITYVVVPSLITTVQLYADDCLFKELLGHPSLWTPFALFNALNLCKPSNTPKDISFDSASGCGGRDILITLVSDWFKDRPIRTSETQLWVFEPMKKKRVFFP